ncbi:MAG: phosphatase PAP2 family protein [Candidatus Dormibacteria bacterium]
MVGSLVARARRPGPLVTLSIAYLTLASGVMIWRGISVSPDYLLLILVPIALLSGRLLGYLRDWVPFVAIFLAYEAMRGIAPKTGIAPHVEDLARLETGLFAGHNPTAFLQSHIPASHPLVIACTVIYFCHFVFPLGVGMVLWLLDRVQYLRFTVALVGMSFFCFALFLLFPTAPPWYAHDHGFLPGVSKLISSALPSAVSPYYSSLNPNPVAAFPSMHAAYPLLGALALWRISRRGAYLALAWSCLVWFSVVYLGEHYVVDVLGGVALALATWALLTRLLVPRLAALQTPRRRLGPKEAAFATAEVPTEEAAVA